MYQQLIIVNWTNVSTANHSQLNKCTNSLSSAIVVHNSQLYVEASVQLDIGYYNSKLGVWEPLFEPIMERENVYRPWEVTFKVFPNTIHSGYKVVA